MISNSDIKKYYNDLAVNYDHSRFSNSYGQFIHDQETNVLDKHIKTDKNTNTLDIACGTGRFLKYANCGVDFSEEMLNQAKVRYPMKNLILGDATSLPFDNEYFDNLICFHLMMHIDKNNLQTILNEAYRVTKKGGLFIFDIPSQKRRKLTNYKTNSWHGANSITKAELLGNITNQWKLVEYSGTAFLPIHRIPSFFRKHLTPMDNFLSRSIFKEYSSHLIFVLKRK